jgi:peptidoglycan/xylan/chitin deacetylase (PgdA/CDA1 family)
MGEAADLNRGLVPEDHPIGSHYSVTDVLPGILALLKSFSIHVTYFVESWNLDHYPDAIHTLVDEGHEVAWHAFQHEAWGKLDAAAEAENFRRSFEAMKKFNATRNDAVDLGRGFRPPGGIIHGERTLQLCREYGVRYISPAAERAAVVATREEHEATVVLPFRWSATDAYYYMETFGKLRKIKGETDERVLGEKVLVKRFVAAIDEAIEQGAFLSLLFHPFLTCTPPRKDAMRQVVAYLASRRDDGSIWLATGREIEEHIRQNHEGVTNDPGWDQTTWR